MRASGETSSEESPESAGQRQNGDQPPETIYRRNATNRVPDWPKIVENKRK
jgi:hypothetical protein